MRFDAAVCALGMVGALGGCLVRAPTTYELDKRAGNGIPPASPVYEHPKRHSKGVPFEEPLRATSGIAPATRMPARTAPVIRRVWVADQTLPDGSWLQGTWWYLEAEPSRWLHEVDPGAAPFAEPAPAELPSPPPPTRKPKRRSKDTRGDERRDAEAVGEVAEDAWFGPFQVEE